jgi:[ribosomal protein S18]-alanine N-acetyltransferase
MSGEQIRVIEPGDVEDLVTLAASSGEGPRWNRREYEQILASEAPLLRCGLVATAGDRPAGFAVASYLLEEAAAELEGLVVGYEYRRLGMGSALVKGCLAWAGAAGASSMRLEVRESNAAAIALYRRLGFTSAGVRESYFSAPREDALLFEIGV